MSRNKDRIRPFLEKIAEHWEKVPDWRFGQLISNVYGAGGRDPFFYEEEDTEELFDKFFKGELKDG